VGVADTEFVKAALLPTLPQDARPPGKHPNGRPGGVAPLGADAIRTPLVQAMRPRLANVGLEQSQPGCDTPKRAQLLAF
jgi:hypothetical protein